MKFANFALSNARGIFASLIVLVVLGLVSVGMLPQSIYPQVAFARVVVVAENGEMAPAQVQQNITRPIEQAVSTVIGTTLVQANSAQGAGQVSITFNPQTDINVDLQRVNAAISQVQANLPPGTNVNAQIVNPNIFPILGYTVEIPSKTLAETRTISEYEIKPTLTGIAGVAQIRTVGGRRQEYWISIDPRQLASYKLSLDKVAEAVGKSNLVTSVGHFNAFDQRQIVLVSGLLKTPADVSRVVVENRNGTPIAVGDFAVVHESFAPKTTLVSANGQDAVLLNIYAQPGGNISQIYSDVDHALAREAKTLGTGATIKPYWNQATLVNDAVKNLRAAIAIGAGLAVLVMWFFLGSIRGTLVAAAVIPLTIAIAFFFMKIFGQGLNLMTLGGLAIGVGLVIVDAIFVVENIWRHLQEGTDRVTAVREAMGEIAVPMIGSTITTIVVFAPMALLSGITGAFFIALSITLTIALALSLFFALYITPLLCAYFLKPKGDKGRRAMPGDQVMAWLLRGYEPALLWFLRHRRWAYGISGAVLLATFLIGRGLGTDFLPTMDEGAFEFNFRMPAGTSLEETDRALKEVETVISGNPNVVAYARLTGLDPSGFFPAAQNSGNIRATMLERDKRSVGAEQIFDQIRDAVTKRVPILTFTLTQILQDLLNDLSNAPATVEVKIFGNDQPELIRLAGQVDKRIKNVKGIVEDTNGVIYSNPNTIVALRPNIGSQAGFTTDSFTQTVAAGLNGSIVTTIPRLPVQIPVRLRYDVPWNQRIGDLQSMPVVAPNGTTYALGALANIVPSGLTTELNEENLRPIVRVTANVSGRDLGSTIADAKKALADLKLPPGYRIAYGGRYALQQQSFQEFGVAIGLAILLVFLTMIFEFRNYKIPLVIISSVPLSLFGVVIALRLTSIPLNVSSFMGLILLVGGVVKNGILLFDKVDRLRRQGLSVEHQMLEAGRMRMRPILMTTLTSMLGVVPLALGIGAGSEMQKPLAVATIGGLIFSTFFTLLFMPAFYASFTSTRRSVFDATDIDVEPKHRKIELAEINA